jgi:MFS family permease
MRDALRNRSLVHVVASAAMASLSEWAQYFGVLVYAFQQGGARAAGLASLALLLPFVVAPPIAGTVIDRCRPDRVRLGATATQLAAFVTAAVAAWQGAPVAIVLACGAVAVSMNVFLRPSCAVLLPSIVRSPHELSVANVWVGWCESWSVLGGPLIATALLAAGGPELVLAACAVMALIGLANVVAQAPSNAAPPGAGGHERHGGFRLVAHSVRVLRTRPGAMGVLAAAGGQYVLLGSLDLVMVVLAGQVLDLGESGAGVLGTAVGVGAVACAAASTVLLMRSTLAPVLMASLVALASMLGVLTVTDAVVIVLAALVVIGFSRSMLDLTARMLLLRSTPPQALPAVFASIELFAGIGMIVGSIAVQLLIAAGGVRLATGCLAVFYAVLVLACRRSMRVADASADIPVVVISLLRRLPAFAPLPPITIEAVARSAETVAIAAGETVVREGEEGHDFFAVVEGSFDVSIGGSVVRTIARGDGFGEVALLADVPRTATVTATSHGVLLRISREPFLQAVTGNEAAQAAAWDDARRFGAVPG